jgi:hypothetical protein
MGELQNKIEDELELCTTNIKYNPDHWIFSQMAELIQRDLGDLKASSTSSPIYSPKTPAEAFTHDSSSLNRLSVVFIRKRRTASVIRLNSIHISFSSNILTDPHGDWLSRKVLFPLRVLHSFLLSVHVASILSAFGHRRHRIL